MSVFRKFFTVVVSVGTLCVSSMLHAEKLPVNRRSFLVDYNRLEAQRLKLSVDYFQSLTEWALSLRQHTVKYAKVLKQAQKEEKPLSADMLESLQKGIKEHLQLRGEVMKLIETYRTVYKKDDVFWNVRNRIKASMLTLAASMVLYDNFALSVIAFQENDELRRLVNRGDKGFKLKPDQLKEVVLSYHSRENREAVREAMDWLLAQEEVIKHLQKNDRQLVYLEQLIRKSPSAKKIHNEGIVDDYSRYLGLFADAGADKLARTLENSMNSVSKLFGNSVGIVAIGEGKLYKRKDVLSTLTKSLKPMDVLLDKTTYRLTDKFIPGYFGHVAIWTGTEKELKELGLWNHPVIYPHQKRIRQGHCIIEALRSGVEINSLEHFSNADDIAVLRLKNQKADLIKEMVVRSFRQVGKDYDFNFDVETTDKIVCSELAYLVFSHLAWPTDRTLGRATISPDNVAVMAGGKGPFELVCFFREGRECGTDRDKQYSEVLESESSALSSLK